MKHRRGSRRAGIELLNTYNVLTAGELTGQPTILLFEKEPINIGIHQHFAILPGNIWPVHVLLINLTRV